MTYLVFDNFVISIGLFDNNILPDDARTIRDKQLEYIIEMINFLAFSVSGTYYNKMFNFNLLFGLKF